MPRNLFFLYVLIFLLPVFDTFGQNFHKEKIPRTKSLGISIGPSFIYADNGGRYSNFDFEWNPSISLIFEKRLSDHLSFRANSGVQWIESGGNPGVFLVERWLASGEAVSFRGKSYFLHVVPLFNLVPVNHHMTRPDFNIFLGIGFGALRAITQQKFSFDESESSKKSDILSPTIPFLGGISYTLNEYWDLALEGGFIFTFSDKIDGNTITQPRNDHLVQFQLVIKKYIQRR